MTNPLILAIDLDEWYHCPWYTGSPKARWQSREACFQDYYGSKRPGGEIIAPTRRILELLKKEKISATFFILGEVASWYPELVKEIFQAGHEIASHGLHHQSPPLQSRAEFSADLAQAKAILEDITGKAVVGFRAPNLEVASWLPEVLIEQGFRYDSSVCPSYSIFGKYKNAGQASASLNPYRASRDSLLKPGDSSLIEIPIPSFPLLKLPGAVSIATRVLGLPWTRITLDNALRTGTASYYMHPYEFNPKPAIDKMSLFEVIYFRRAGAPMLKLLQRLLTHYRGRVISMINYLDAHWK